MQIPSEVPHQVGLHAYGIVGALDIASNENANRLQNVRKKVSEPVQNHHVTPDWVETLLLGMPLQHSVHVTFPNVHANGSASFFYLAHLFLHKGLRSCSDVFFDRTSQLEELME